MNLAFLNEETLAVFKLCFTYWSTQIVGNRAEEAFFLILWKYLGYFASKKIGSKKKPCKKSFGAKQELMKKSEQNLVTLEFQENRFVNKY